MDKLEYNLRATEIKELIKEGDYAKAADIADTIDWRRVKSIMMLCTVSDVYKINRRYIESRDILSYAYERNPKGRLILYYLCELSIKLEDVVSALEYYKRFAQLAPADANQFILLYKIYEAQDATLEERIAVLEELKRREYKEKWSFELAYLYHITGQTSLCIEECDEIFLWFGKGKYVTKALELKQLHVELPDEQAARLDESQQDNTSYEADNVDGVDYYAENNEDTENAEFDEVSRFDEMFLADGMTEAELVEETIDIRIRPVDVSDYNTINLQQELAENMKELLSDDTEENLDFAPLKDLTDLEAIAPAPENEEEIVNEIKEAKAEVYFGDTGEMTNQVSQRNQNDDLTYEVNDEITDDISENAILNGNTNPDIIAQMEKEMKSEMKKGISETGAIKAFTKASSYDEILSQGYDGQISLVVPDEKNIEKQITGQLKIDDILTEWERQKKEIEQKRKAEVRSKIQEQTATLFNDFDTQTKMGLLEKLEKAMVNATINSGPNVIKVADIGIDGKVNETISVAKEPEDEEIRRILEAADDADAVDFEDDIDEIEDGAQEIDEVNTTDDGKDIDEVKDANYINVANDAIGETESIEEAQKPEKTIKVNEEMKPETSATDEVRDFSDEEKIRFGRFVQHKKIRRQLVAILDKIKGFDGPNHVLVTGEENLANMKVVKGIIKEVKNKSGELHGKVVKISGDTLNKKSVIATFSHLTNGIIIIDHAADMKKESVIDLMKIMNEPENKLMIILEDNRSAIDELLVSNNELEKIFPLRIDLNALDNQTLVEYAKKYAFEQEYSIDEFGILALHTRIAELQTSDHEVTTAEVEEIVEEAMYYADRKNPKHFFDILAGKRYDEEDMIVLREKDFLH